MRGDLYLEQIRLLSATEKIKILAEQTQHGSNIISSKFLFSQTWYSLNRLKGINLLELKSKTLIIYPYSVSNNLLKEVLAKMGINFILTNEISKASIIIGLKKYLKKNNTLIQVAKNYSVPVYSFNFISYYQLIRLFSTINNYQK